MTNSCTSSGVPRITDTYARPAPRSARDPLSRMSATSSAMASPIANDARVSGMVPRAAPRTIGHSERPTRSQSMSALVSQSSVSRSGVGQRARPTSAGDVLAEVLLGDLREGAVLAELRERLVDRGHEVVAALAERERVVRLVVG